MNKINEDDRVEILDNGVRIGWIDVVTGQWSLPVRHSLGSRHLTVKYKGLESDKWNALIGSPVPFDSFDDAPNGVTTSLSRPFFSVSYEVEGQVGSFAPMHIYDKGSKEMRPPFLALEAWQGPEAETWGKYSSTFYMDFNDAYSSVFFWLTVSVSAGAQRLMVVASDALGSKVDELDLIGIANDTPQMITLEGRPTQNIKRLTFFLVPAIISDQVSILRVFIDDILMRP